MSKVSSPTAVIRAHGVLTGILDIAMRDRRITQNPAREIKLPRNVPKEHVYLTHQQVHNLANASGDRAPIILLLCYTGLRWAEVVGLRVKDIDFERRRIRVSEDAVEVDGIIEVGTPKSHKRRTVPFPHPWTRGCARWSTAGGPRSSSSPKSAACTCGALG
jgi:integrase